MKKLKHVVGNLLTNTTVEVIGHQANCQNTFGSGIARSIREMFPAAYYADTDSHREHKNSLGNYSAAYINSGDRKGTNISIIYNLYGQNLFGKEKRQTNWRKCPPPLLVQNMMRKCSTLQEFLLSVFHIKWEATEAAARGI